MKRLSFALLFLFGLATALLAQQDSISDTDKPSKKLKGTITQYDVLGRIRFVGNYKHGLLDGPAKYYSEGALVKTTYYKKDQETGVQRLYDPKSGATYQEMELVNGHKNGYFKQYTWVNNEPPHLYVHSNYRNDTLNGKFDIYNRDNRTSHHNYANGVLDGTIYEIGPNDSSIFVYVKGIEQSHKIYKQGKLMEDAHWVNGSLATTTYYSNGHKQSVTAPVAGTQYRYQQKEYYLADGTPIWTDSLGHRKYYN